MKIYMFSLFLIMTLLTACNPANNASYSDNTENTLPNADSDYTLLAWNDLGMHCYDGSDFSVFSILPPYNNLNAHLILKDGTSDKHITSGVSVTYESYDYYGHINTTSSDKTNFWDYISSLFPGATSVEDTGLTGNKTPSTTPQAMSYNQTNQWWEADGIPIVNKDDDNTTNYYPMVKVVAKDTSDNILATAEVVLPVSDEMNCAKCHSSTNGSVDAKPIAGWEDDNDSVKDYKFNILKLHDENHPISQADLTELATNGYNYQASLYDTAKSGMPILCSACHASNALGTTNVGNARSLTSSIHLKHSDVKDYLSGLNLGDSTNRDSCYSCHPGSSTQCLRGAMGSAKNTDGTSMMQCQSCHGTMSDVGNTNRNGWLDQPNCQACHQDGERYTSAISNGSIREALDTTFATKANTPMAGVSLYRYSSGHGDLQCSSCHGSTHAIFPSSHEQDNLYTQNIQGHSGTLAECMACHTTMPNTTTGGPHGMHSVGQTWVGAHEDVAENSYTACAKCHGSDYRGSYLSKTFDSRSFNTEHGSKSYTKGEAVGCYDCHNGPNG